MAAENPAQMVDFTESTEITAETSNNQGVVRLCTVNGRKMVWKVSQGYDFVIDHEVRVMEAMNPLEACCPNFMYSRQVLTVNRDEIPAELYDSVEPIKVPATVLVMDCIETSEGEPAETLAEMHDTGYLTTKQTFAITMQILNALWFGQKHAGFTHYDLHPGNILIRETDTTFGALYITDSSASFTPVYGQIPVIFDYGHSYVAAHDHKPCYSTLEHAGIGYLSCVAHPWMDTRAVTSIAGTSSVFAKSQSTNTWLRWLSMLPRRGFRNYYGEGWEQNVELNTPTNLGEWLSAGIAERTTRADESSLELAGDTLCALAKFPFMNRRAPEFTEHIYCFERLVRLVQSCITTYIDADGTGVIYALVRAYINRENLETTMQKLRRFFKDPACIEPVTKNKAKTVCNIFRELAGYVEHFMYEIWQSRESAWDAKSHLINSRYRTMESIAWQSMLNAPEGIGEEIKNLGEVTVYDLTRRTTVVIPVPEFPETPAELTMLYRRGIITDRIREIYDRSLAE